MSATTVLDMRSEQDPADSRTRLRRGRTVQRDPPTITGVVLHQTAVLYGVTRAMLRKAAGNRQLALARRIVKGVGANPGVPAHAIAMRDGFVIRAFDLTAYCYHANELNASTLGLEVEGRYSGLLDDPDTLPDEARRTMPGRGEPDVLDDVVLETARAALRFLVTQGLSEGMPLAHLYAHRQSSRTRRADPGEGLWRALEPTARELGLAPDYALVVGDGRPVPTQWAEGGVGRY